MEVIPIRWTRNAPPVQAEERVRCRQYSSRKSLERRNEFVDIEEGTRSEEEAEADTHTDSDEDSKNSSASDWEYIRVGGLGILLGLICPPRPRPIQQRA
jgi:hypothetical protein